MIYKFLNFPVFSRPWAGKLHSTPQYFSASRRAMPEGGSAKEENDVLEPAGANETWEV
jgi:hypothetical protein